MGIRKRQWHLRSILREGLEAALRADPKVLETCAPKTGFGLIVRGLVLEAGRGRTSSLKTLMSLIDWEPEEREENEEFAEEAFLDWNKDGMWLTMPEKEVEKPDKPKGGASARGAPAARGAAVAAEDEDYVDDRWPDGPQAELERRLKLLMSGNEADQARAQAIIAHIQAEEAAEQAAEEGRAAAM